MTGTYVTVAAGDGGEFKAYVSTPETGSGPGIVLLQEIFGVNRSMRDVADYYAEEGYVVIAPDLFWRIEPGIELGYTEADVQKGRGYKQQFDVDQALEDIAATVRQYLVDTFKNPPEGVTSRFQVVDDPKGAKIGRAHV